MVSESTSRSRISPGVNSRSVGSTLSSAGAPHSSIDQGPIAEEEGGRDRAAKSPFRRVHNVCVFRTRRRSLAIQADPVHGTNEIGDEGVRKTVRNSPANVDTISVAMVTGAHRTTVASLGLSNPNHRTSDRSAPTSLARQPWCVMPRCSRECLICAPGYTAAAAEGTWQDATSFRRSAGPKIP